MNMFLRLFYTVVGDRPALQRQLQQDLEKKLRDGVFERDASGNVIVDDKLLQRLRAKERRRSNWTGLVVSILFLLGSVLLCNAVMTTYHRAELLRKDAQTKTAVVTKKNWSSNSNGSSSFWVTYTFDANGKTITSTSAVGRRTFYSLDLQGPVLITFAGSDPSVSYVTASNSPDKDLPLLTALTCMWVLATGFVFYCWLSSLFKLQ
jgi:hypothetical protein